jgi:hypothetical protein
LDVRSTHLRRLAAVLAFATAVFAAAPAVAKAPPTSCRGDACTAQVRADRSRSAWRSPEVFYPRNERVYAGLSSSGVALRLVSSYGRGLCRHRFAGSGLRVVVKACGAKTPIRVRVVRAMTGLEDLRIDYAATTVLGDGPAPEVPLGPDAAPLQPITAMIGL